MGNVAPQSQRFAIQHLPARDENRKSDLDTGGWNRVMMLPQYAAVSPGMLGNLKGTALRLPAPRPTDDLAQPGLFGHKLS